MRTPPLLGYTGQALLLPRWTRRLLPPRRDWWGARAKAIRQTEKRLILGAEGK